MLHGLDDFAQRRVDIFHGLDGGVGPFLPDPFLDPFKNVFLRQVEGGDAEGLLAQLEKAIERIPFLRPVGFGKNTGAGPVLAEPLEKVFGRGDAPPGEVIHHFARNADEEFGIGIAQEIESQAPAGFLLPGLLAFLEHVSEPLVEDEMSDAFGDRMNEFRFPLKKRTVIRLGDGLPIGNAESPHGRFLDPDLRALRVGRFHVVLGFEDLGSVDDLGLDVFRILPARGNGGDDIAEDFFEGQIEMAEDFLDAVKTAQLLSPLVEGGKERLGLSAAVLFFHGARSFPQKRRRSSGSTGAFRPSVERRRAETARPSERRGRIRSSPDPCRRWPPG